MLTDGGPHKTSIGRFGLTPRSTISRCRSSPPRRYLRATVTNTSPLLLLPGPARVFHGPQFVRETSLPTVAAGEEFELQLGVDDQIRVERTPRRPGHRQGRHRRHPHDRHRLRDHRGEPPHRQDPGQRARPHPGVHRRRHQGPAPGDEPGPGHSRPTWASSPGSWRSTAARRRRSGTGSPSSIRPRSR